jgi:cell division protein FtsB
MMKIVIGLLVVLLLYLQYSVWLGNHGVSKLRQLQKTIASQEDENKGLRERNQILHAEVVDLKQGTDALEERARSELGMIKQGETFYQVIDQNSPPAPVAR